GSGLVASLAQPGGNTTGVSILASELDVKRLEILHEFIPQARRIAVLIDTTTVATRAQLASAARDLGVELVRSRHRAQRRSIACLTILPRRRSMRSMCWPLHS